MNDYEKLMQAAEFVRKYLEEHCGLNIEIRISRDRVDVLRCELGIPFSRTKKMNSRNSPSGLSCGG